MGMVMITGSSSVASVCCTSLMVIMAMIAAVFMTVMSKMCCVARRVFQRIANTLCSRMNGIQRKHDGKKKGKSVAHGETIADEGVVRQSVRATRPPD